MAEVDAYQRREVLTLEDAVALDACAPTVQRVLDASRVAEIVAFQRDQLARHGTFCFLGDIVLFDSSGAGQSSSSQRLAIVDGQHRYAAMRALWREMPAYRVGLTLLKRSDAMTLETAFRLVNLARPVPAYVINTTMQHASRALLDGVRARLLRAFPDFVSNACTPRRPNFNPDRLITEILAAGIHNQFPDSASLFAFVMYANERLRDAAMADPRFADALRRKARQPATERLRSRPPAFFSADPDSSWMADATWLSDFKTHAAARSNAPNAPNAPNASDALDAMQVDYGSPKKKKALRAKRAALPKHVRHLVWTGTFGPAHTGKCPCCRSTDISYTTFHAGHLTSVAHGGSDALSNLLPICAGCNQGMGASDMSAYRQRFGFDRDDEVEMHDCSSQ